MHAHLPKPLHGWRQFVGEVGMIAIGVLIALGAESLVGELRWHYQVRSVQSRLKEEIRGIAGKSYERLILQPCIKSRISELGAQLRSTKGMWKASPMMVNTPPGHGFLMRAYRVPNRPIENEIWLDAARSGSLSHMPRDQVTLMVLIYSQHQQFHDLQEEEARAAARLMPLAYDVDLSADKRVDMLAVLGDLDRMNAMMAIDAAQIIDRVRRLNLGLPQGEIETTRRAYLIPARIALGACVANDPLSI